jgi:hypothetical protein
MILAKFGSVYSFVLVRMFGHVTLAHSGTDVWTCSHLLVLVQIFGHVHSRSYLIVEAMQLM